MQYRGLNSNIMDSVNTPLVSIFCLTYNHSRFIREAMNGFLMQKTSFPFEIIVYDDCSTDGNQEIIREYIESNPYVIRAFLSDDNHYKQGHIGFGMYRFLDMAHGQYIAICEGDDYWTDPFKLQKQVDLFRANPGMTYCFTNRIVKNELTGHERKEKHQNRRYTQKDFLSGFNPGLQSAMFEIRWIRGIDFSIYKGVNGDRLYPFLCTANGYALCLQEETAVYRVSPIGVSSSVAMKTSPSVYFKHACDDFYRYHERTGFTYRYGYMKASANYAMRYLFKHRDFHLPLFYEMTSRYDNNRSFCQFIKTMGVLLATILGKSFKKICSSLFGAWNWLVRKIKKQRFCSCIVELSSLDEIASSQVVKVLNVPKYSIGNVPTTIADIFLFTWHKKLYAFYEYQNKHNAKGVIYMTATDDFVKWSRSVKVLEETVHLSFPSVFEDKGQVYMMPETSFLKEVRLYKANESMTDFTYVKTLLAGERFVDSSVYVKDGIYYLFTSVQHDDNSYDLRLYYSDRLEGEWHLHPSSPLSAGKADARNAGSIIDYNGMMLRPAQECRKFYGQNVHLFRIKELSVDTYSEEPYVLDVIPNDWEQSLGGHQLSMTQFKGKTYAGVDLLKRAYRVYDIIHTIKEKI